MEKDWELDLKELRMKRYLGPRWWEVIHEFLLLYPEARFFGEIVDHCCKKVEMFSCWRQTQMELNVLKRSLPFDLVCKMRKFLYCNERSDIKKLVLEWGKCYLPRERNANILVETENIAPLVTHLRRLLRFSKWKSEPGISVRDNVVTLKMNSLVSVSLWSSPPKNKSKKKV